MGGEQSGLYCPVVRRIKLGDSHTSNASGEINMKSMSAFQRVVALVLASLAFLAGCGGGSGGGDSSTSTTTPTTGTLSVAITDSPACGYDQVFITVEKVRVHQSATANDTDAGWQEIVLNPAKRIDLLALTNGVLEELGQTALPGV